MALESAIKDEALMRGGKRQTKRKAGGGVNRGRRCKEDVTSSRSKPSNQEKGGSRHLKPELTDPGILFRDVYHPTQSVAFSFSSFLAFSNNNGSLQSSRRSSSTRWRRAAGSDSGRVILSLTYSYSSDLQLEMITQQINRRSSSIASRCWNSR